MLNKIYIRLAVILLAGSITLASCRKKEEKPDPRPMEDTEQSTANDNNMAEAFVSDIETIGSELAEEGALVNYRPGGATGAAGIAASPCVTVTGIGTKTITVDFGQSGCIGADGRARTGKLIYDFSASSPTASVYYRNPGFAMTVTSQNYIVDGHQVSIINKSVRNTTPSNIPLTPNPGINLTWSVTANVNIIKANNAGTISWSCTRTKELVNTADTSCYKGQGTHIRWSKAIVKLNGTSGGVNAKAENFTSVATDLVRDFTCAPDPFKPKRHPFVSGTISYSPGTRPTRLVDFGNGNCDMNATVAINSNTFSIVLQ